MEKVARENRFRVMPMYKHIIAGENSQSLAVMFKKLECTWL